MRMDSSFDRWRKSQAGYAPLFYESLMRHALDHVSGALRPGAVVLDAGCGAGHVTWALGTEGACGIGIDQDRAPEWTSRGERTRFVQASVEALPLRDAVVDALFCFSVLQYVDRQRALDEFARVLKPGAPFALLENLADHPAAVLHRVLRPRSQHSYAVNRRYPSWRDLDSPDPRFAEWLPRPFALLSPLVLALPGGNGWSADLPAGTWSRRLIESLERWDRLSFAEWPRTRNWAWLALTLGKR